MFFVSADPYIHTPYMHHPLFFKIVCIETRFRFIVLADLLHSWYSETLTTTVMSSKWGRTCERQKINSRGVVLYTTWRGVNRGSGPIPLEEITINSLTSKLSWYFSWVSHWISPTILTRFAFICTKIYFLSLVNCQPSHTYVQTACHADSMFIKRRECFSNFYNANQWLSSGWQGDKDVRSK